MAKDKLTKKQLEQLQHNEIEDALLDARDYVTSHKQQTKRWTLIGVGVAVGLGLVLGGVSWRSRRLNGELAGTLALYSAPVVTEGSVAAPGQKVYKDESERKAEIARKLQALVERAPSSTAGRSAAVLLMAEQGNKGVTADRLKAAEGLAKASRSPIEAATVAVSFLEAKASAGGAKEAIEAARKYVDSTSSPLPKDVALYTLARLYEKAGQTAEAKSTYQRLVSEFPDSTFKWDSQQKADSL